MMKLAVITSHPIQYYAPWFRQIAATGMVNLRVFYLWDFGVKETVDPQFKSTVKWDIPLLDGYEHEFVPNTSPYPSADRFNGLVNPELHDRVKQFAPDAVLMMLYNYSAPIKFILRWDRRRAPLLFRGDSHRLVPRTGWKETARRTLITQLFKRFDALLYVGRANHDYYRMHGVPESKLFFSPHCVDNDRFRNESAAALADARAWRAELGIPEHHKLVLFAGKFIPKKRPLDLVEGFLAADVADSSLLMVGAGELESELRRRAAGHANIHFAPFQNQTKMPRTYAAADLMVLPSHGTSETWGLAINEAMCLSRAVLVSSHVGCSLDLVKPGENGLVFNAGDVADLTAKLRQALQSETQLHEWGARSCEIIDGYNYARATDGLFAALQSLGRMKKNATLATIPPSRERVEVGA